MGSCFSTKVEQATTSVVEESQGQQQTGVSEKTDSKSYVDPLQITLDTTPIQTDNVSDISMESNNQSTTTEEKLVEEETPWVVVEEEAIKEETKQVVEEEKEEEDTEVQPSLSTSSSIVIPMDVPRTANIIESQMDETLIHAFCEDVLHVIHTSTTETGRPKYIDIRNVDDVQDIKKIVLSLGKQKGSWEKVEIKDVVYVIRMLTYEVLASQSKQTDGSEPITAEMIYKKKLQENQIVE
jgi:hypothetical protein